MDSLPEPLVKFVRRALSPGRWRHTRGVVEVARRLGSTFTELPGETLLLAALAHDSARGLPPERQRTLAECYRGSLDEWESQTPVLWHAPAGAELMAREEFFEREDPILVAISYHSTGHPSLTPLLKGLLVADYAEPNRDYSGAAEVRNMIKNLSLDGLVRSVLKRKMIHCLDRDQILHPWSLEAYNKLCD